MYVCPKVTVPFFYGDPLHKHCASFVPSVLTRYVHSNGRQLAFYGSGVGGSNIYCFLY